VYVVEKGARAAAYVQPFPAVPGGTPIQVGREAFTPLRSPRWRKRDSCVRRGTWGITCFSVPTGGGQPLKGGSIRKARDVVETTKCDLVLPTFEKAVVGTLLHFSEDPTIRLFRPHVAATADEREPFVWAVDDEHAPSFWFPRDCPRACCWAGRSVTDEGAELLGLGGARRLHAIEARWLDRVRDCRLYAYKFDSSLFRLKLADAGYWVAQCEVKPMSVRPVGDLLARHAEAEIELRIVQNLWPLIDKIIASGLEFSIIRKRNAVPRAAVT